MVKLMMKLINLIKKQILIHKIKFDIKKDLDALCLIDLCDLVISTDNVTVRLSGSINKETWIINSKCS